MEVKLVLAQSERIKQSDDNIIIDDASYLELGQTGDHTGSTASGYDGKTHTTYATIFSTADAVKLATERSLHRQTRRWNGDYFRRK